jgi:L-alanine-DL-glutamate epimerase-like enolase superfamily enzyme
VKIVKVECIPVTSPLKKPFYMPETVITGIDSVVLKLTTDEGLVGISDSGDTSSWYRGEIQESMMGMILGHIAPRILLGEDPTNIEKIVGRMDTLVRDNNQAKATVDFALHDLKGKIFKMPVYQLLGGKCTPASQQGWVVSAGKPDHLVKESLEALKHGFALIKLKIGAGTMDEDVKAVAAVREAVGPDVRMTVDVNGFWNYDRALKTMRRLDPYDLECVEQPLPHWDIEGMARLRGQIRTPVFADESAQELHHLREIIERRAADGLFIKMQKAGGLLKSQRWLTMARLADMAVMSGCMIGSGLEASPSAHLMVANQWASQFTHENVGPLTIHGCWDTSDGVKREEIAINSPVYKNGALYPNEGPGYGIELNEDFIGRNITKDKEAKSVSLKQ